MICPLHHTELVYKAKHFLCCPEKDCPHYQYTITPSKEFPGTRLPWWCNKG